MIYDEIIEILEISPRTDYDPEHNALVRMLLAFDKLQWAYDGGDTEPFLVEMGKFVDNLDKIPSPAVIINMATITWHLAKFDSITEFRTNLNNKCTARLTELLGQERAEKLMKNRIIWK